MQLKSCWHSWESVTTIQSRNNSSFSIPCDLSESCSLALEPEYPKFWFQFWLLLSFVPEDIKTSWRLSLKLLKRGGTWESRCDSVCSQLSYSLQHLQRCSLNCLGPNTGHATDSGGWRRIPVSIVTSFQWSGTGTTPEALNAEKHRYREKAVHLPPRKVLFSDYLFFSVLLNYRMLIVKTSQLKFLGKHGVTLVFVLPGCVSGPT